MQALSPEIRRVLRDPAAAPRAADAGAHAQALVRGLALRKISAALAGAGLEALLVKGAALALTVYADPAARPMGDVDLMVRAADHDAIAAALRRAGACEHRVAARPVSGPLLGETQLTIALGAITTVVELHATLDKIVPRPVDAQALFARATRLAELPGLLVPSPEDHVLLVALHAAGDELHHPIAFLDLELLLRAGVDAGALAARAREWRLSTALWAALSTLRDLGATAVPGELLSALEPGPIRRAALGLALGRERRAALGWPWIVRQTPLRDDLGPWAFGLLRYAGARAVERTLAPAERPRHDAPVSYRVPAWVRALLAVDRAVLRIENAREGLRDELLLAWIPPADRARLTAALYSDQSTYLPGGERFKSGLFSWEKRMLDAPQFPRSGKVLVGAAGAGRELVALVERGFSVVAFDPCAPFVEAARALAPRDEASVTQATYQDLVDAAAGRGGPLAEACTAAPFDAVVLGWGSLSHVLPASDRTALLRAVRVLCPAGPVLTSFALEADAPRGTGKGRVRDALRRVFGALEAPGTSEPGDHFFPQTGFFSYLRAEDLTRLAWEAGYEVAAFEDAPYPHALLIPHEKTRANATTEGGATRTNG